LDLEKDSPPRHSELQHESPIARCVYILCLITPQPNCFLWRRKKMLMACVFIRKERDSPDVERACT